MERDDLLQRIRSVRTAVDEAVSRIPDDVMVSPSSGPGGWSAKDQVAHLATWHRVALARITGADEDALVGWSKEESATKTLD